MTTVAHPMIDAIFVGGPKTLTDAKGEWHSSISRQRCDGSVSVTAQGIAHDKVTQLYHGGLDAALCVHLADHYRFWHERYGVALVHGAAGENLTIGSLTEDAVYAGDIVRLGTVLAQVSGPRVPCANLARHIGRSDWVRLTVRENRTGFYMRVLEPGTMRAGDPWTVEERFNEDASIPRINRCMYLDFDPAYANRMLKMAGIGDGWRQQAAEKLAVREEHWTSRLKDE